MNIREEYKCNLDNLTARAWINLEIYLKGKENRTSELFKYISNTDRELTIGELNEILTQCPWIKEQQDYQHTNPDTIVLNNETYELIKDMNDMTISQYIAYEQSLQQLSTDNNQAIYLTVILTKKENEEWNLDDKELLKRYKEFENGPALNIIKTIPFLLPQENNSDNDTQSYLKRNLGLNKNQFMVKRILTKDGGRLGLLSQWWITIQFYLRKYLIKKLT